MFPSLSSSPLPLVLLSTCSPTFSSFSFLLLVALANTVNGIPVERASIQPCFTLPSDSLCGLEFEGTQISTTFAANLQTLNEYIQFNSNLGSTGITGFATTLAFKYQCPKQPNAINFGRQKRIRFAASFACAFAVSESIAQGCAETRPATCRGLAKKIA
ncbi:hypothetical protein HDU97_003366 [Phlyctochytrium planicorne]|nr:hypothetical protein HDU97_003366 [Phlyctochytrium planicorne]